MASTLLFCKHCNQGSESRAESAISAPPREASNYQIKAGPSQCSTTRSLTGQGRGKYNRDDDQKMSIPVTHLSTLVVRKRLEQTAGSLSTCILEKTRCRAESGVDGDP